MAPVSGGPIEYSGGDTGGAALVEIVKTATASLTVTECKNSIISNYGQSAAMTLTLPVAQAGLSFMVQIVTTGYAIRVKAGSSDKIYLDGTALDDADQVSLSSPVLADCATFWTFQTGESTYDWYCNTVRGVWSDGGA